MPGKRRAVGALSVGEHKGRHFWKGNTLLCRENLSEDSHNRRMQGLYKAWAVWTMIRDGKKHESFDKKVRKRMRLKETVAKEAADIQAIARKRAASAIDRLSKIVDSPSSKDSDAITAASVILDRAYGRAQQTNINATVNTDGKPNEVSSTELHKRIEKAVERINSLTDGASEKGKSEERSADVRLSDTDTGSPTGSVH